MASWIDFENHSLQKQRQDNFSEARKIRAKSVNDISMMIADVLSDSPSYARIKSFRSKRQQFNFTLLAVLHLLAALKTSWLDSSLL